MIHAPLGARPLDAVRAAPRRAYLRALSSTALVAPLMLVTAQASAQTVPSGGTVVAGSATIGAPAGGKLRIDQSSSRAIIDWTDFSIGQGGVVSFNNGDGATLNRVTGRNVSSLDGLISATGSVYLLNPNGVVIGKNGVVDVGGSFAGSTLDIANDAFMAGGDLALAGNSLAPVINLGRIGALGGDVVLAAMTVENKGTITSPAGTAGLLAGSSIVLSDQADGDGRFKVLVGGGESKAANAGKIAAAAVELRANGGSIYALAGDTRGIINATGVRAKDGRIFLTAGTGGRIDVADSDISARSANGSGGTIIVGSADTGETRIGRATVIDASAASGAGGFVETSAAKVEIADDARVRTRGAGGGANGTWLIDPVDFVVAKSGGSITGAALSANLADNNVSIEILNGSGGNGDVIFQDDVNWAANTTLTVNSFRDILIRSQITATGGNAGLVFNPGQGTDGSYKFQGGRITLSGNNASFQAGGTSYTLIRSLADLSAMSSTGAYVLAVDIDAAGSSAMNGGAGFNPLADFSGTLDGFGHVIDGLFINRGGTADVGLFGQIAAGGVIQNIGLSNVNITGGNFTGALAGRNSGTITNAYATGAVVGGSEVGGLVGATTGAIDRSYASANVTGSQNVGGLVGQTSGAGAVLDSVYASGTVVADAGDAGGLVGRADSGSSIANAYATGMVAGSVNAGGLIGVIDASTIARVYSAGLVTGSNAGGFAGASSGATVSYAYWDAGSGGRAQGWGTRTGSDWVASFNLAQNNAFTQQAYGGVNGFNFSDTWYLIEGRTRPFLRSEWSATIVNHHQLQLMALNLAADYILAADIDLAETARTTSTVYSSGMWSANGFVAIGRTATGANLFTGTLDGRNHVISNIYQSNGSEKAGLIAHLGGSGVVRDLALAGGRIFGTYDAGSIAGYSAGTIDNVTSSVAVDGYSRVGGLVGTNAGTVRNSSADGAVAGQAYIGGLIGVSHGTVENSSAAATLTATVSATHIGGLIGATTGGSVIGSSASAIITGTHYLGGLIGHATGTAISDSFATGDVTGSGNLGGLVGYVWQGQVANSYAAGSVTGSGNEVGGLVGFAYDSDFENVWVGAANRTTGTSRVGGLIGWLAGGGSSVTGSYASGAVEGRTSYGGLIGENDGDVSNSYATGAVSQRTNTSPDDQNTGGLIGLNSALGRVSHSYATGTVAGRSFVGGLVGMNRGAVADSWASGNVLINQLEIGGNRTAVIPGGQGGGLAGANVGTIARSHATGDVTSTTGGFRMGGLVGVHEGPGAQIEDSYATGSVTSTDSNYQGAISGYQLGGLVGYQSYGAQISGSYATGAVSGYEAIGGLVGGVTDILLDNEPGISNSYATGNVNGTYAVGGLVGRNLGGEIRQAFASGQITGHSAVGGLVGDNRRTTANAALITQSYASGQVSGIANAGGLAGHNSGRIWHTYATGSTTGGTGSTGGLIGANAGDVGYSYSVGAVSGANPMANFVGGLIGSNDALAGGTVVESYWDINLSGRANSAAGTARTSAQMLNPETFRNWDIASVWAPAGGGYRPELYGVSGVIGIYAGAFNRSYGDANPSVAELNASRQLVGAGYWNQLNGAITGTFSTDSTDRSDAGLYFLTASRGDSGTRVNGPQQGGSARIVYVGTLEVMRRALTVTALGGSSTYGGSATNPGLDWVGLTAWDAADGNLLASLSNSFAITAATGAGDYTLNVTGDLASGNYDLSRVAGQWTVNRRALTVTANSLSRIYGNANPELSWAESGLVNGDTLSGALTTSATVTSGVGTYAIEIGTLAASDNYALTFTGALLSVTPRALTVTANGLSRVYGDANPALTWTAQGLVNGDTLDGALATSATQTSGVGSYAIGRGSLGSSNYAINFVGADLTITPRALTVTANGQARNYGDANPTLTWTADDLVNGDTLNGVLATGATQTSGVGSYAIGLGTLGSSNYAITFIGANLQITPRALTVTANGLSRVYGDANPTLTWTADDLVNGDTLNGALATSANQTSGIGSYAIGLGSLGSSNYAINFVGADLTITPRALTVTADGQARNYGDANPALTWAAQGLVNGDTLSGELTTGATVTSGVGSYAIELGTLAASNNYDLNYEGANLTITPRALTVTANGQSRTYGDANPALTWVAQGLVNGDTLSGELATGATTTSGIGTYAIELGNLAASNNYVLNYEGANLTITPRALTVTANGQSRVYGDTNPALTWAAQGLVNGDTLSGELATGATTTSGIGTHAIELGNLAASNNYILNYEGANLTITPRALTVTANGLSRVYGDTNPALTWAAQGLVNGDILEGSLTTAATETSGVGIYAIERGSLGSSNYAITFVGANLQITPRALTVRANGLSRAYGDFNPTLTWTALGLVNGDTLSGELATGATATSGVGSYAIELGTLGASANYALSYEGANLEVTRRALTVTANGASRTYGDANPALTWTAQGLVNGDTLTGALATGATVTSGVGTYAITRGDLAASNNYVLSYEGANLRITPRALTVTADNLSRTYGDANPALTWTAQGLVNGDTLSGSLSTGATLSSGVGRYAIALGSLGSGNYAIDFIGGELTVTPRALVVAADSASRIYGDANPALTWTAQGLVNGDTLTGALATGATASSGIGNYDITRGTIAASSNYVMDFTGGLLSVTPRALVVTANNLSRVYGDANPALTWTEQGLANGDTLSGALSTAAGATSNVGNYDITQGTLAASANYALTYVGGVLQVTPRALLVRADNLSRQTGEANPALTWTAQGLVNGDTLSGALATSANNASAPGGYAITRGSLAASDNYALTFANGILTVRPGSVVSGGGEPIPNPVPAPQPPRAPDPALLERNFTASTADAPAVMVQFASTCPQQDDCLFVYPTNIDAAPAVRLAAR